MIDDGPKAPWSRLSICVGVTLWTSFLAACLETVVFFAYFDPVVLGSNVLSPPWLASRPIAYGAGFFFFWAFNLAGCALTAYMLERPRR